MRLKLFLGIGDTDLRSHTTPTSHVDTVTQQSIQGNITYERYNFPSPMTTQPSSLPPQASQHYYIRYQDGREIYANGLGWKFVIGPSGHSMWIPFDDGSMRALELRIFHEAGTNKPLYTEGRGESAFTDFNWINMHVYRTVTNGRR